MALLLDLVVPGAGPLAHALPRILALCNEMKEGQDACTRLHARLQDVLDALSKYLAIVAAYFSYLQRNREKPLLARIVGHRKMMDELVAMHEDLEMLFRLLSLAATSAMMD